MKKKKKTKHFEQCEGHAFFIISRGEGGLAVGLEKNDMQKLRQMKRIHTYIYIYIHTYIYIYIHIYIYTYIYIYIYITSIIHMKFAHV